MGRGGEPCLPTLSHTCLSQNLLSTSLSQPPGGAAGARMGAGCAGSLGWCQSVPGTGLGSEESGPVQV